MTILLANHTPILGSGSGNYTLCCAKRLSTLGHRVIILAIGFRDLNYQINGVEVLERKPPLKRPTGQPFPSFTGHPSSSLCYYDLSYAEIDAYREFLLRILSDICIDIKIDVIHVQHIFELAAAAYSTGIPTVVTAHGSEVQFAIEQGRFSAWYNRISQIAKMNSCIIVVSDYVGKILRSVVGEGCDFYTIPCGYDAEHFFSPLSDGTGSERNKFFLMAGRFVAYKRFEVGIIAFQEFLEKTGIQDINLLVCGEGTMRSNLESLVLKKNRHRIIFPGFLEAKKLAKAMNDALCVIVPSRNEPFGLIAIESLACGTPVIAAASGGLEELVTAAVGVCIPEDKMDAWTSALQAATVQFRDNSWRERCISRARSFSWTQITNKLVKIYERSIYGVNAPSLNNYD